MKKYFLSLLVALLPMIGWAAEPLPELALVSSSTEYAGNATVQPDLKAACWQAGGQILAVYYLGLEGEDEAVQTFDVENPYAYDGIPVRDAGIYKIVAAYVSRQVVRAPGNDDTALDGDGDGDDDGDDDGDLEEETETVELTYTVDPKQFNCMLANTEKKYGDPFPAPEYYSLLDWPAGDKGNYWAGGKIAFSKITFDQVGVQSVWCYDSKNVHIYKADGTLDTNYAYRVLVGGTATCEVLPAEIYARAKDATKVFGECDENVEFEYEYLGWVTGLGKTEVDTYEDQVTAGKDTEKVVRAEGQEGEDVAGSPYGLTVDASQVEFKDYEIVYEPFEFNGEMLPEQGKLTIEQKSITEEMVSSIKYFVDGVEAAYNEETGEVEGFTYGKVLTWEITMIDNDVCISETGKRELTDGDVDKPVCVDGDCGDDDLQICGKGNYKECIPFRVPDPQPTCLNITAGAEPGEFTLGEEFEINYEITGWQKGEDFSEAVEDVISYEIYDAAGEKVELPIENAGEYTVKFTVGELPAEPAGLANYKVCDEPEDITITVDPICIEDATITIERTEGAENCFPFTGSKIEPAVTVTLGDKELVEGTDYEVTYGNEDIDNIHVNKGGIITVTGINNYDCDATTEFCIAPGEATVYVAPINFDVYETILDNEGKEVKQYQNGKFYGQYEAERNITLAYEGITAEELKNLGLDIYGKRYTGNNVGFYSVEIRNGDEVLTPEVDGKPTEASFTFEDITINFVPGLYEIRKNSDPLNFHADLTEVYGEIGIDLRAMANDPQDYFLTLIEEYRHLFKGENYHGNDSDDDLVLSDGSYNINIVDPTTIQFPDGVTVTKDGEPFEFVPASLSKAGYAHVGKYHFEFTGASSVNYNIGKIDFDLEVTQRPIKITFDDVELAPREEIDLSTVTWTAEANNAAKKRGYAVLDAPLDGDNSILNVVPIIGPSSGKLTIKKSVFNPDYKPSVDTGEITNAPGHFIIHRVAADLQDNPWNDAVAKITAFDGQTVDRVYFRTFNLAGTDNLFDDLFNDGELEPVTAEVDGELDTENGFPMYADKWYAMVLPFDVTVYELGHNFFEYAVINVLDESNTKENVIAFKLQATGTIKANTPFCVKLGDMGQVNPETGDADLPLVVKNLDQMYFENKLIVKPADFENIYVEDASGVRFYGSYDGKLGFKANEYFFTTSSKVSTYNNYYYGSEYNTTWLRPSGSFLYTPEAAGARTIIMQEEDGSFTAIESIENMSKVNTAEGWFTTNGVKLNAQPTQKGVYIHNGKKIVVK